MNKRLTRFEQDMNKQDKQEMTKRWTRDERDFDKDEQEMN